MSERPHEKLNEDEPPEEMGEEIDEVVQQCVEDLNECHLVCVETAGYALQAPEAPPDLGVVRALLDAADVTQMATALLLRRSDFTGHACALAADVCSRAADQCRRFPEDQWMVECGETCRRCTDSCRDLAQGE